MEMTKIFESHAHYDDEAFDEDREELLGKMQQQGIEYIINIGANIDSSKKTVELTEKYPFLYGAVGVHPSDTAELDEQKIGWLKLQCERPKIVAVGEIGLDYYWDEPERPVQRKWFCRQLDLAREVKLPVVIHSRDAAKDTLTIMKEMHAEEIGGVVHCFSYSKEMAEEYLKLGFYIGVGGVVTFNNAKKLKEAVEFLPMDKILLETDSPYLTPVPNRGKRNSSLNLPYIARQIAELKGISYEQVVEITNRNARKLFFRN
ncbi:TatD family hydrolase [Diplocloster modestus]|uniref:TatD family hydrolase n=1 Tax=Diplocloster modestus TaxID=2850322 RepID=A0ABS6KCS0_9FIRM|nr:TatD family hydrolase [Diplocloster modestus]MBU9728310.1 TatD family hydrolase [Diplocloster modestus]